jgi:hypothetical protein
MTDLLDIVSAERLLKMVDSTSFSNCSFLELSLLNHNSINKQYRREIAQVWACNKNLAHAAEWRTDGTERLSNEQIAGAAKDIKTGVEIDKAIGVVLCELGTRKIEKMRIEQLPAPDLQVSARFKELFQVLATNTSFDKFGDQYLWNLLRFELPAPLEASLSIETPYEAINSVHGDHVNDLVQGWVRTLPQDLPARVDFTSMAPQGLVCIAGILQEHLDDTALPVYVNGAIARPHTSVVFGGTQGLCDIPDTCGCIFDNVYYVASETDGYVSVVLKLASLMECRDLFWAIVDPIRLPPVSPLKQYT